MVCLPWCMRMDVLRAAVQAQTAVVVSHSSIVIPYFLGVALAGSYTVQLAQQGLISCICTFMGISMSITRFPVCFFFFFIFSYAGSILQDSGILKRRIGSKRHGIGCSGRSDCMRACSLSGGYRAEQPA